MKQTLTKHKASMKNPSARLSPSAGSEGIAMTPPVYGIDFLDRGGIPVFESRSADMPVIQRTLAEDIAPSYVSTGGTRSALIHRGLVETEMVQGKKYVRAYQTVYASVNPGSSWKDIHQQGAQHEKDRKIKFIGKGDTWINFGNPLRALHYVRTYAAQAPGKIQAELDKLDKSAIDYQTKKQAVLDYHGKPVVRSFLISYDVFLEVTGSVIDEPQRGEMGAYSMNVDKSKAPDQYQLLEKDASRVEKAALPGSLISYVMDGRKGEYSDAFHGRVEEIKTLSEKLGLPSISDSLTIPMEGTNVPSTAKQAIYANELGELYDLSFLVEKKEDNPQYAGKKISKQDYLELYLKKVDRIADLAQKYLGTDVLPNTKVERDKLRKRLAAAADAALIPALMEESYEEGRAVALGSENQPSSTWAKQQAYRKVQLNPLKEEKGNKKLSKEEITRLRKESEERKKRKVQEQKSQTSQPTTSESVSDDNKPLLDIFD